jgi:hypothetical protein
MAAWFTVYCRRSVAHLTAADLLAALNGIEDIHTLAEGYGVEDDDEIDRAMENLRIEPTDQPPGFCLRYRPGDGRPISIWHITDPECVFEQTQEAQEALPTPPKQGPKGPHVHLGRVVEVVALEMGWSQLDDMGVVLASQVAQHFAAVGDGVFEDPNDAWWAVRRGVPVLLAGPDEDA